MQVNHVRNFNDKVVIVTGASKGIGRGIAKLFAQEGANVVLVGRDEKQLKVAKQELEKINGKVTYVVGDVGKKEDMDTMANKVIELFGRIDILCPNAGIYPHAWLEKMEIEQWDEVIRTNLTGTFLAVRACIPQMKKQNHGKIVITSSISGPQTAHPGYSHYTASKGGIAGFVKTAAVELAKYNINVNAVEPGNIMTEGLEVTGEQHMNNMLKAIPMGRLGTPEDVANAVLFLSSNQASYITGQSLIVDGGQVLPESHFAEY
jgi:3-oxoacyl-[acyl-carrier protein] reductase